MFLLERKPWWHLWRNSLLWITLYSLTSPINSYLWRKEIYRHPSTILKAAFWQLWIVFHWKLLRKGVYTAAAKLKTDCTVILGLRTWRNLCLRQIHPYGIKPNNSMGCPRQTSLNFHLHQLKGAKRGLFYINGHC